MPPFSPENALLFESVSKLYKLACGHVTSDGPDVHSGQFLDSFPYAFIRHGGESRAGWDGEVREVLSAAFADQFRGRAEGALSILFGDRRPVASHDEAMRIVLEDFLNDAIPRCIGLPNEDERFENLYRRVEHDLYDETFTLETLALIEGVHDHGLNFHATNEGESFGWASRPVGRADHSAERDRVVTYFQLKKGACALGGGRSIAEETSLFLLFAQEEISKAGVTPSTVNNHSTDITRKVVFVLRLLSRTAVFSDYRGHRTLGCLAPFNFYFFNSPDEFVPDVVSQSLTVFDPAFHLLLPIMKATQYSSVVVIAQKMDDAFRRHSSSFVFPDRSNDQVLIDRLLDYVQILEAILPTEASYKVWMWASALLGSHLGDSGARSKEVYECLQSHYKKRNDVIHGRSHTVSSRDLDIPALQQIVHDLATLKILNRGVNLSDLAQELLFKRPVAVARLADLVKNFLERPRRLE